MSDTGITPFLRWAGSKRKLLPKLMPYWEAGKFRRYIEPFMGSAALFFALGPDRALLSDINDELVETFKAVRDHPRAIYNRINKLPVGEKHYYSVRALDPLDMEILDRAARFIYLNRFCFNGIYRTNLDGQFNVPYAPTKTGALPDWEKLKSAASMLKRAEIVQCDFQGVINKIRPGDFIYMDPPYAVANRRIFRQYGPQTFGLEDINRLRTGLEAIDSRGAHFLVSYALCTEAIDSFSQWNIRRVRTQRNVSGFSEHRRKAVEILVSNI